MKPLWANFAFNGFVKKKAITIKMSGKRASYSMKFKINAAKYAKETNVSEASRNFEVDRKRIREWVSHFDAGKLQEQATSSKRLSGGGRKLRDVDIDQDIFEWFTDRQSQGMRVTGKALLVEAQRRFFAGGITAFKASRGWLEKWKTRHSVLTRVKTTVAQKMPPQMEDKILSFHRFVIRMRKLRNYPLANIGNMDETAVYFDMPGDSTLHHKGEKTVIIRTTGHEKDKVTVILAAMADGRKLLPVVILKGKREPPASDVPRGVLVKMSNNGWVNEDIIKWWVVQVWRRSADRKLLVWDAFRAHRTKAVKELLSQRSEFGANSDTVMMPGGCTSILQPADVSWNKPFKSYIQEKWDRWMVDGQHTFTPAGRMRKPENKVLLQWVKEAWDALSTDTITKSFKKTGISNMMDGTEDDDIWYESSDDEDAELEFPGYTTTDVEMTMSELQNRKDDESEQDMEDGDEDEDSYMTDREENQSFASDNDS